MLITVGGRVNQYSHWENGSPLSGKVEGAYTLKTQQFHSTLGNLYKDVQSMWE